MDSTQNLKPLTAYVRDVWVYWTWFALSGSGCGLPLHVRAQSKAFWASSASQVKLKLPVVDIFRRRSLWVPRISFWTLMSEVSSDAAQTRDDAAKKSANQLDMLSQKQKIADGLYRSASRPPATMLQLRIVWGVRIKAKIARRFIKDCGSAPTSYEQIMSR